MKEKILNLRKQNLSYNEISKILGVDKSTISYHCIKSGLNKPVTDKKIKISVEVYEKIKLLEKNKTKKEISEILGISYTTVKKYTDKKIYDPKESLKKRYDRHYNWRFNIKKQCVDFLGGKCEICGYNKNLAALDFHHKNPNEKDFSLSGGNLKSFKKIKSELEKCMLVCSNCHREIHSPNMFI